MSGELQGPFPIKFDPDAALIHDQRKILDMTATSWLSFREFNGLLVYYTQLMSYRCAIREVRVGIDSAVPDKVLKMPPCDPRDPSVILHDAQPYLKLAPSTEFVSVELTYPTVACPKSRVSGDSVPPRQIATELHRLIGPWCGLARKHHSASRAQLIPN